MKRKDEDRLVRLAFGDLSLEESAALERRAISDPEAAKTLSEYRSLRDDLRSLAEVPPHQLSNERLREAILGQGLKPKPIEPILSWLWMPACAACLVAISFLYVQRHRAIEPQIVGSGSSLVSRADIAPSLEWNPGIDRVASAAKPATVKKTVANPSPLKLVALRTHTKARRHHTHALDMDDLWTQTQPGYVTPPESAPNSSAPDPANPTADLKPVDNDPATPVVLIDPETDQNTGASKATEVGSGKNVVVGG